MACLKLEESHGGAGPDSELSKPVDSDRSVTVTVIISNCTCTVTLGVSLFTPRLRLWQHVVRFAIFSSPARPEDFRSFLF